MEQILHLETGCCSATEVSTSSTGWRGTMWLPLKASGKMESPVPGSKQTKFHLLFISLIVLDKSLSRSH